MASLNNVQLIGRLGAAPELRYTTTNKAVASLSVATSEQWTDQAGQKQERTEWHKVVVWDKQAENCERYLQKGQQVFVEGKITTRKWQDKDGQDRYTTEIVARNVIFLSQPAGSEGRPRQERPAGVQGGAPGMDDCGFNDDSDIPF